MAGTLLERFTPRSPSERMIRPVSARGAESPQLPDGAADELVPEAILHHIEEADHLDERRPSSVAKNTLADRRISFAFSNSTICFFNRLTFICATDGVPGA